MQNFIMQDRMGPELVNKYNFLEDDICAVWCIGLILYSSDGMKTSDILQIARIVIIGSLDYNKLFGFFKIVVVNRCTAGTGSCVHSDRRSLGFAV